MVCDGVGVWMVREEESKKGAENSGNSEEVPPHKRRFATLVWRQICGIDENGMVVGRLESEVSGNG